MTTTSDIDDLGPVPHLGYSSAAVRPGLRSVHRTANGALRRALATLPDYRDQIAALRELANVQVPEPLSTAPEATLAAELCAALHRGDPAPTDFAARAHEVVIAGQVIAAATNAVDRARDQLAAELDQIVLDCGDEILQYLNDQLAAVIQEGREIAGDGPLGRMLDADAAVAAGRVEKLSRFSAIAAAYAELRGAQDTLMRGLREPGASADEQLDEARIFRNVVAVLPAWAAWREYGYLVTREHGYQRPITPPWPHSRTNHRQRLAMDATTPAFLAWAIDSGAALWIPDRHQVEAEEARLNRILANPSDDGDSDEIHPAARQAAKIYEGDSALTTAIRTHRYGGR